MFVARQIIHLTVFDLLSVLQDGVDRGSTRTVGGDRWQHCLVHLLPGGKDGDDVDGDGCGDSVLICSLIVKFGRC